MVDVLESAGLEEILVACRAEGGSHGIKLEGPFEY